MRRGTGAGNPLADLLFLIAFAVVIRRLRKALKHAGLETSFSIQGARDFLGDVMDSHNDRVGIEDASYADDLVFLLVCQAADAFSSIQRAGAIVWQTYLECGFRVNFGPKKTAVLVRWRGSSARVKKAEMEHRHQNMVPIEAFGMKANLDVVERYKHVGTTEDASGSYGGEVVARSQGAWSKIKPLKNKLFGSDYIRLDIKQSLVRILFLSSQVYNAGTWPILTQSEYVKCKTAIIRVYKMVCRDAYAEYSSESWLSDEAVVTYAKQTHPAVLLRELRLLTSVRMAVKASWSFWGLLYAGLKGARSWLDSLHHDIRWLCSCTTTFKDLDSSSLAPWLNMARANPRSAIACIRKAVRQEKAIQVACAMAAPVGGDGGTGRTEALSFQCPVCTFSCSTMCGLQGHLTMSHGRINELTACIDTPWCTVCGLRSASVNMNLHHAYEGSEICRHNLLKRGPFLEGEALVAVMASTALCRSESFKAGNQRRKADKSCIRSFGPHQQIWTVCDSHVIVPSKRGHPLGSDKKRKLHLPPHLWDEIDNSLLDCLPCHASLYSPCTDKCVLCRGRVAAENG